MNRWRCTIGGILLIAAWAPAIAAGPVEFELSVKVTEADGLSRKAQPITGGLPVPPGKFRPGQPFALLAAGGREIPCQVSPLVVGPDGSLEWVLLDFQDDLPARQTNVYSLRAGKPTVQPPAPLTVIDTPSGVTIDTGAIRFSISRKKAFGVVETAAVEGKEVAGGGVLSYVQMQGRASWNDKAPWRQRLLLAGVPESVKVCYAGPMRATVEVLGRFDGDGLKARYQAWITAWAGQSRILVKCSLCNSNSDQFTALPVGRFTLELPLKFRPEQVLLGADEPLMTEGDASLVRQRPAPAQGGLPAARAFGGGRQIWAGTCGTGGGWVAAGGEGRGVFICDRDFSGDAPRRLAVENGKVLMEPIVPLEPSEQDSGGSSAGPGQAEARWLYDCSHHTSEYIIDFAPPQGAGALAALAATCRRPVLARTEAVCYDLLPRGRMGVSLDGGGLSLAGAVDGFQRRGGGGATLQVAEDAIRDKADRLIWRTDGWTWKDGSALFADAGMDKVPQSALWIDNDRDGYGVAAPDGPDADDDDPEVNTFDSIGLKHGDLKSLLNRRGYAPARVFYVSPDGSDAAARPDDIASPYANWGTVRKQLRPGDMVIFRAGTYKGDYVLATINLAGQASRPIVFAAMPGERVVLDAKESCIEVRESSHLIFDGFVLDNTQGGYGQGVKIHLSSDVTFRNIESMHNYRGIYGGQDLHGITVERCVVHDNGGSHGIYFGAQGKPNSDITIRDCIIYHSGLNGIQHNGRVTNLRIENNIIHSNKQGGVSLIEGVSSSLVRGNCIFNNNQPGVILYAYDEENAKLGIVPYDQCDNVIANNLIWMGRYTWQDGSNGPVFHPAIRFNDATARTVKMEGNVIRNNVLAVYDGGGVLEFAQSRLAEGTRIENNFLHRTQGDGKVLVVGKETYDFAGFARYSPRFGANVFEDPRFADASFRYYATPEKYNFRCAIVHRMLLGRGDNPLRKGFNFDMGTVLSGRRSADAADLWRARQAKAAGCGAGAEGLVEYFCLTGDRDALYAARDAAERPEGTSGLGPWALWILYLGRT